MPHTPGPWTMSLYPDIDGYKIMGGKPAVIAIVKNQETRQIGECQANAELLLSAPDLLAQTQRDAAVIAELAAALKDEWGFYRRRNVPCQHPSVTRCQCEGCRQKRCESAIAAAESRAEAKPEPEKRCDGYCWTRSFDGEPCAECRESMAAGPERQS